MTTFVLVSGAWLGGWAWKRVVPLLRKKGNDIRVVPLTGMGERVHLASKDLGLEAAIQDVVNEIAYNDLRDLVLVGHSFAGKVAAAAADRVPDRIRLVLYLDAFRPAKVRTPQGGFDPSEFRPEGWKVPWTVPFTEKTVDAIGSDVRGADRAWMLDKATPWPARYASDPITLSEKFDSLKSAYILCTKSGDDVEAILKEGLDGPDRVIDSGHWPMVTKPRELAEAMLALAGGTSKTA